MEYKELPKYNTSNYNISNDKPAKKETSKLAKIVTGIALTSLAVLPLAGCIESYSYNAYPRRQIRTRRPVLITPRYNVPRRHVRRPVRQARPVQRRRPIKKHRQGSRHNYHRNNSNRRRHR
jgi:hypothetical protein